MFTEYFLNNRRIDLVIYFFLLEQYLSRQEEKSRRPIFLSTIGLSVIAVTLACIHIVLCFVDVDICWRKTADLDR